MQRRPQYHLGTKCTDTAYNPNKNKLPLKKKQKKIKVRETNQNYTQHFQRVWKRESH